MSYNAPLCITGAEYATLASSAGALTKFISSHFLVEEEDHQFSAVQELMTNMFTFARAHLSQADASAAFVTVVLNVHNLNVSHDVVDYEALRAFAMERIVAYSLECPPFYARFFDSSVLPLVSEFVEAFYLRHFKLWRYLFTPTPMLTIESQPVVEITQVQSPVQLGYPDPAEVPSSVAAAKPDAKRPFSRGKGSAHAAEPAHVTLTRPMLPFTQTLRPLSEAEPYTPPPPKTEEEVAKEEVREAVESAAQEELSESADVSKDKPDIDVERYAEAIERAATAELEKIRTNIMQEIAAAKAAESGKKK